MPVLRLIATGLVALTLIQPLTAHAGDPPQDPSEAAMTFAAGFSHDHLSGMLSRIGARQPPLVALSQLDGELLAAVFDAQIDQAVIKYGDEWQRNMALAWTPLLTDEELTSLTNSGAQSPYTGKYLDLRDEAGQSMQALSGPLFRTALEEVIRNTLKELSPDEQTQ